MCNKIASGDHALKLSDVDGRVKRYVLHGANMMLSIERLLVRPVRRRSSWLIVTANRRIGHGDHADGCYGTHSLPTNRPTADR